MGLKEAIAGRAERIVMRDVPGIGNVRIKRLKAGEMKPFAEKQGRDWNFAFIQAAVMGDEGRPFFSDAEAVADTDRAIVNVLLMAVVAENELAGGVDKSLNDAEKK